MTPPLPAIPHSAPTVGDEEVKAVGRVVHSGHLAAGKEVAAFEEEFAAYLGRRYAIAVSSGTAGLHLALDALDATPQSVVALPSYACAALLTAVKLQGSRARLCDVGADYHMSAEAVTQEDDFVILPHLFGAQAALPDHGKVIEDVAQSMGLGTGRGTVMAVTSLYATKLLTTGEGGMIFTDDTGAADLLKDRRDYDNRDDFLARYNYKMTDFQAAMGRVQLGRLPGFIERRRSLAHLYLEELDGLPLDLPDPEDHVFFRFVVGTDRLEELQQHLKGHGIEAKRPVHRPAHQYFSGGHADPRVQLMETYRGAEKAHHSALSLPLYPSLEDAEAERVIKCVVQFFNEGDADV